MRLPPTNTLLAIGAGVAAVAVAAASLGASSGDFMVDPKSGWRTWRFDRVPALRKLLASAHLEEIDPVGAKNTYRVVAGPGPGGHSALDGVRAMQMRGSLVTTTTTLLSPDQDAPRGVAEIPAAELTQVRFGSEADGIAALPIGI